MDALPMALLTLPIVFSINKRFGFDPVWFGVRLMLAAEMALITPSGRDEQFCRPWRDHVSFTRHLPRHYALFFYDVHVLNVVICLPSDYHFSSKYYEVNQGKQG